MSDDKTLRLGSRVRNKETGAEGEATGFVIANPTRVRVEYDDGKIELLPATHERIKVLS